MSGLGMKSSTTVDHLMKVHGVACAGLAASAVGVKWHFDGTLPGGHLMTLAQVILGMFIGWMHVKKDDNKGINPIRLVAMLLFGLCAGANVGTWIQSAFAESGICEGIGWAGFPDQDWLAGWFNKGHAAPCAGAGALVWEALSLTSGTYACFFFSGLIARDQGISLFWMSSFISAGLWILFFSYFFAALGLTAVVGGQFELIYIKFGLLLYCFKIAYETQVIVEKVEKENDRDVVSHALTMMLNFLHLFIRIIKILAKSKNR